MGHWPPPGLTMPASLELEATQTAAAATVATVTDVAGDANDPSVTTGAYERMKARWQKCRDCFGGTEAIRAGGTKYLAQFSAESNSAYEVRRVLAAFYNAYARTVYASVGMLLEEPPTLGDDMPEEIKQLAENVDGAGTHLNVFTRKLATAGVVDGLAGILVEHTRPDPASLDFSKASADAARAIAEKRPLSSDDEKALGMRPYFVLFKTDDVIKPLYATVNGVKTLVLLVLREITQERTGLFGLKTVTRYRVYTNDRGTIRYSLWRAPDVGGRPIVEIIPTEITNQVEIPWSPLPAGEEVASGEYKPPLLDLADVNIQYHNSLTNHLNLEALAYVPTPVRIGAKPDKDGNYPEITLGPRNTIEAPVIEGVAEPVYWLSPPVEVLDSGEKTLQRTKADMATLGAAFMSAETRAAETAEGKRIDSSAQRATLGTLSDVLKDCLERAFGFMAAYRKLKGGSVTLNQNFTGEGVDAAYIAAMLQAYTEDTITLEEFRYIVQTGQLPEDFNANEVTELLARSDARAELKRQDEERRRRLEEDRRAGSGGAGGAT